jgi:hypothetical protein
MKPVTAYSSNDGSIFKTEEEAIKHDMVLAKNQIFTDFLNSKRNFYQSVAQRAIARNSIINWEIWKSENT